MDVIKVSISLSPETVAQLEYLRDALGIYPNVKRSQLIAQIIFDDYCRHQPIKAVPMHGFPDCPDDCRSCEDQYVCDYFKEI